MSLSHLASILFFSGAFGTFVSIVIGSVAGGLASFIALMVLLLWSVIRRSRP